MAIEIDVDVLHQTGEFRFNRVVVVFCGGSPLTEVACENIQLRCDAIANSRKLVLERGSVEADLLQCFEDRIVPVLEIRLDGLRNFVWEVFQGLNRGL